MQSNKWTVALFTLLVLSQCNTDSASELSNTGQGGSMTRFAISHDHLYIASHQSIVAFDIKGDAFEQTSEVTVDFALETIFAKGDYLYLGASDAMYIYSIANPSTPEFIFRYSHITSCDPVVVQGNRAYVTLRGGTACNRGMNALEIIDITDPYAPVLISNYPLTSPFGLGIQNSLLFLCEGEFGLKVLDVSTPTDIRQVKEIPDIHAYDVIVRDNIVTVTGEDGVFQYEIQPSADNVTMSLLSKIAVNRSDI